jgi:RHS repeat-associated protein
LFNARGDVVRLTGANGVVTKRYRYDAFGNEVNPDERDANVWRYTGEYFDKETGTVYLRFRNYNPRIGRFLSVDPLFKSNNQASFNVYTVRQTTNLYAYVANNPIRFVDPWGLRLREFTEAHGGTISWDAKTRTATATINGQRASFTDGVNGIYIDKSGTMQISLAAFNRVFGFAINASSSTAHTSPGSSSTSNGNRVIGIGTANTTSSSTTIQGSGTAVSVSYTQSNTIINAPPAHINLQGGFLTEHTRDQGMPSSRARSSLQGGVDVNVFGVTAQVSGNLGGSLGLSGGLGWRDSSASLSGSIEPPFTVTIGVSVENTSVINGNSQAVNASGYSVSFDIPKAVADYWYLFLIPVAPAPRPLVPAFSR